MYCKHCGRQLEEDARFCPGCGKAQGEGAVLTDEEKKEAGRERRRIDDQEKLEYGVKAAALGSAFGGNVALKILGFLLRLICLPLIPVFFILGYIVSYASGLLSMIIGLLMLLVAVVLIMGLYHLATGDPDWAYELSTSIGCGIIFAVIQFVVYAVPALFMGIAYFLLYFVFPFLAPASGE